MSNAARRDWLGIPIEWKTLGPFMFVQHLYPTTSRGSRHAHAWMLLAVVQRGHYSRTIGNRAHECRPGELSLLPAYEPHTDEYAPGSKCLHLVIPPCFAARLTSELPVQRNLATMKASPLRAASAVALYRELVLGD